MTMATRTTTNMVVWMIALHPDTATVASPSSGATRNRTDLPTIDKCNYCKQRWRIVEVTVLAVKELLTVSMPESKILFLYYHIPYSPKGKIAYTKQLIKITILPVSKLLVLLWFQSFQPLSMRLKLYSNDRYSFRCTIHDVCIVVVSVLAVAIR